MESETGKHHLFVEQEVPEHLTLKKKKSLCVIVYWQEFFADRKNNYNADLVFILLISSSSFLLKHFLHTSGVYNGKWLLRTYHNEDIKHPCLFCVSIIYFFHFSAYILKYLFILEVWLEGLYAFILEHSSIKFAHLNLKFNSRKILISSRASAWYVTTYFQRSSCILYYHSERCLQLLSLTQSQPYLRHCFLLTLKRTMINNFS